MSHRPMNHRLGAHHYGKGRVRVMRLHRGSDRHTVNELTLSVTLFGDAFAPSYDNADNRPVVATDTMKNLAYVVAAETDGVETLSYLEALSDKYLTLYDHVQAVAIVSSETVWQRLNLDGRPHPHAFQQDGNGKPFLRIDRPRGGGGETEGGIDGRRIMKSTGSAFEDFLRDRYTTLPDVSDRFFATEMTARWAYSGPPADPAAERQAALTAMDRVFADTHSVSVQDSLYRMGCAALDAVPALANVTLAMPNLHYLPTRLDHFGIADSAHVFVPSDEPHGQIQATVERGAGS